ncbi:HD domain-containing protein [Candidatus Peregrinibacteria bacterium]|nr:HD domain-containing protein [Candidatus Peregrinibacteria bacterium]
MADQESKKNVDMLYELGTLRFIDRSWKQFQIPNNANVTEHIFRVQMIALLLAKMEGIADAAVLGRIALMALFHDVTESRTGDVAFISRQYTERNEVQAAQDMFGDTLFADLAIPLWEEAHKKESLEAKIVKDADNLDCDLELREMEFRGERHVKTFMPTREYVRAEKLYTESAKQLWDEIYEVEPLEWVMKARNRLNSGDWKTKK